MSPLASIIRRRRKRLGLTLQQLAHAADCSKAYLSGVENDRHPNPPGPRILCAIEQALHITPGRLLRIAQWQATPPAIRADFKRLAAQLSRLTRRNDGSLNLDSIYHSGQLHRAANASPGNLAPLDNPPLQVPLINKVAAGYPTDFTDLDYPARVADEYVASPDLRDSTAFAARVVGDSMRPDYRPGDIVVFSPERQPADGDDCFVRLLPDHQTTFKRAFFEPDHRLRLQPLNPAFSPTIVALDDVDGVYPAVFRIQPIEPARPPR